MVETRKAFMDSGIDPKTGLRWRITRTAQETMIERGGKRFVSPEVVDEFLREETYSGLVREMRELASDLPLRYAEPGGSELDEEMLKYCPTTDYHYRVLDDGKGNVCVFPCVVNREKGQVIMITSLHYRAHSALAAAALGLQTHGQTGGNEVLRRRA